MDESPPPAADPETAELSRLVKSGESAAARALAEKITAAAPDNVYALFTLGRIAMEQFRWHDAIALFDRLLRLHVDPWTLGNLGVCHWKVGNLGEAEYCLRGVAAMAPDFARARVHLGGVLHALQRFDEALKELDVAATLDREDHQVPMRRACSLAALGRLDEAQDEFARAAALAGRFTYQRLIAFDRATYDRITTQDERVSPPVPALERPGAGAPAWVALISCNPPYVRKYGFPFIRSFAEHARDDTLLHLHIYDPDETIVVEIARLMNQCKVARYTVTTERSPFPAEAAQQRKAFYACGRLIHLPYWLEHYGCPVLSLDVDFIVERDPGGLITATEAADAGLNLREPVDSPWLDIIANIIVAKPTPAALRYFTAVKNYALHYLRREPDAWLVDQSALYCVLKMTARYGTAPNIARLPAASQSCLWHIGHAYDHLLADPRFRKYAGK
jgi:tetratricopeptide (TPR) repeat protein